MGEPKVVARYFDRTEADVARTALEGSGIPVEMADENFSRITWFYCVAIGGVRLYVPEEYLAEARDVLTSPAEQDVADEAMGASGGAPDIGTGSEESCERCGSFRMRYTSRDRRLRALSMLLMWLGIPLPLWGKRLICESCGNQWAPEENQDPG